VSQFGVGPGTSGQQGAAPEAQGASRDAWPGHGALFGAAPAVEILSSETGVALSPRRRRRTALVAGVAAVAVIAAGGAAVAAFNAFNGGGAQPEDVLPASTIAFVKVDLDPSAGQKIELYKLLQKFPRSAQLQGTDTDFGGWLVRRLLESGSGSSTLSYAADVQPWLGQRFAVATVPSSTVPGTVDDLVVLQESDDTAAAAALEKIRHASSSRGFDYAFADGYVVVSPQSPGAAHRAVAAASSSPLGQSSQYLSDVAGLGSDEVITGWADATAERALVNRQLASRAGASGAVGLLGGAGGLGALVDSAYQGRFVLGVHAADGSIEIQAASLGGGISPAVSPVRGIDHVARGAVGVVAISGVDARLAAGWKQLAANPVYANLFRQLHQNVGLDIPGDLQKLLGSEVDLSVGGDLSHAPVVVAASTSGDPAAAKAVFDKILHGMGARAPVLGESVAGGVFYVGSTQNAVDAAGTGQAISANPLYSQAVADPAGAQLVGFVDLTKIWADLGSKVLTSATQQEAEHLAAVGLSVHQSGADTSVVLRIVLR